MKRSNGAFFGIFIFIVVFTINLQAFEFDIWKSGDTISETKEKAKNHNIDLERNDSSGNNDGSGNLDNYSYGTELLGGICLVYLYFTKKSEVLYKVELTWYSLSQAKRDEDRKMIIEAMVKKYGKSDSDRWDVDKRTSIELTYSLRMPSLIYADPGLLLKENNYVNKIKEERRLNIMQEGIDKL